ncbi:hypothetical protein ACLMJK_004727 [Lecanora helva]
MYWPRTLSLLLSLQYASSAILPTTVLQRPPQNSTLHSLATTTPAKWPLLPAGRLDIDSPYSILFLSITFYGPSVPTSLAHEVITSLSLIDIRVNAHGPPYDVMNHVRSTSGIVSFDFVPRLPLANNGIMRRDLDSIIVALGSLVLTDGPRNLGKAYVFKDNVWAGWLSLRVSAPKSGEKR